MASDSLFQENSLSPTVSKELNDLKTLHGPVLRLSSSDIKDYISRPGNVSDNIFLLTELYYVNKPNPYKKRRYYFETDCQCLHRP